MIDYVLSVLTVFVVILIFLAMGHRIMTTSLKKKTVRDLHKKEIIDCKNPNCVRCSLYSEVVSNARVRLEKFVDMNLHQKAYDRIEHSFSRNTRRPGTEVRDRRPPRTFQNPKVFRLTNLASQQFFDNDAFAMDVDILKDNFEIIHSEFCNVLEEKYDDHWLRNDTPMGKWSVFHLVNQGKPIERNIGICKNTFSIVNTIPSLMCNNVFGNVVFSVVEPETIISKHYGPTNVRVRCHLGLVTPSTCTLSLGDMCRTWTRGDCLIFDDSFLHEVHHNGNLTEGFRAVLIVDLWHPGVTDEEKLALDYIFSPR